ncbi:B3/B4 domain-containing protein [Salininema proteolyticum]|uniref:B3/4 domain-containing protein n=1 Tax=Salininema proteolyticum TaxID=1607685 RepID=A0ABV8TVW8_9ACTN
MKITLDPAVAARFPEARIAVLTASGVDSTVPWPGLDKAVAAMEDSLADESWTPYSEQDAPIASWHEAYREFGVNPRRLRPSVDALSRRLAKSGRLPRVHPAVDAYNLASVASGCPAGAFDLKALGDAEVSVRFAAGTESFTPLGEPEKAENPKPGEAVYASGEQVLTRAWNHRDCDRTKVTENSTDVVFLLERISASAVDDAALSRAAEGLADSLRENGATVRLDFVSAT